MSSDTHADPATAGDLPIDDFAAPDLVATVGTRWRAVSDRVMGGVSRGTVARVPCTAAGAAPDPGASSAVDDAHCLRLSGDVSLANNGGFIQAALDLAADGGVLDASRYRGLRLRVAGNGETYVAALRTPDCVRPWQSYRASFVATSHWRDVTLPFAAFDAHRLAAPLDLSRLRRLGLLAIGREFHARLFVAGVWLTRD